MRGRGFSYLRAPDLLRHLMNGGTDGTRTRTLAIRLVRPNLGLRPQLAVVGQSRGESVSPSTGTAIALTLDFEKGGRVVIRACEQTPVEKYDPQKDWYT
jgi:hypothetical protein